MQRKAPYINSIHPHFTVTGANEGLVHAHPLLLAKTDQVLTHCRIAREKREVGDYDAGCSSLKQWWKFGDWPKYQDISQAAAGGLLLTCGVISAAVARSKQGTAGQKWAEVLLSGAHALFTQAGAHNKATEARIELGCCFYHQGLFEVAQTTLQSCFKQLSEEESELKVVALVRLAIVERHSSHLHGALSLLDEAASLQDRSGE